MFRVCLILFFLCGCSSTKKFVPLKDYHYEPKAENCQLDVFMPGERVTVKNENLGFLSINDSGVSLFCSLESAIISTKQKACSLGADAIQITSVKEPSSASTCFRTQANILKYL